MGKYTKSKTTRPAEPEAARTTIVGGRPPRGGKGLGDVPRGVEVLVKKAAVDPAFKKLLLEKRAEAAQAISLTLSPAEKAMLNTVPETQLRAIVANTKVNPGVRPAFLGYAAGAMLAALGAAAYAEDPDKWEMRTTGIDAEMPPKAETAATADIDPSTEYGTISGSVTDEKGNPIKGALVVVRGANRFAATNDDGYYEIRAIPEGIYEVIASGINYTIQTRPDIRILPGANKVISFVLKYTDAGITGIRPDFPVKEGD